jgi:hypothetical protein
VPYRLPTDHRLTDHPSYPSAPLVDYSSPPARKWYGNCDQARQISARRFRELATCSGRRNVSIMGHASYRYPASGYTINRLVASPGLRRLGNGSEGLRWNRANDWAPKDLGEARRRDGRHLVRPGSSGLTSGSGSPWQRGFSPDPPPLAALRARTGRELAISRMTVRRAITELVNEGLLTCRHGPGNVCRQASRHVRGLRSDYATRPSGAGRVRRSWGPRRRERPAPRRRKEATDHSHRFP